MATRRALDPGPGLKTTSRNSWLALSVRDSRWLLDLEEMQAKAKLGALSLQTGLMSEMTPKQVPTLLNSVVFS